MKKSGQKKFGDMVLETLHNLISIQDDIINLIDNLETCLKVTSMRIENLEKKVKKK